MIDRRDLLILLGAAAVAPRIVLAQAKPPVLIGWLNGSSRESDQRLPAFKEGLAALGWKDGAQIVIEERWANGRSARLLPLAHELAAKRPVLIVAAPGPAVRAAAKAAPTTPVVQATGGDPVAAGHAASLARPGGMVTGVTNLVATLAEKYLELLLAAAPKVRRIGFLRDLGNVDPGLTKEAALRSVARYPVEARFAEVTSPEEIEPAISRLAKEGVQALVVFASQTFYVERRRIIERALAHRWPVVAGQFGWAEAGALLSYSSDTLADYRRAAYYVDRILKGAKPGDLPIEQSTRFELVLNMKTAKALKLDIPRELTVRADKVIE